MHFGTAKSPRYCAVQTGRVGITSCRLQTVRVLSHLDNSFRLLVQKIAILTVQRHDMFFNLVANLLVNILRWCIAIYFTESAPLRAIRTLSLAEDPIDARHREPSPAKGPESNIVHITGLTRPFTLPQLKELLGRTGTLQTDGFWIDSIKSHCYVAVSAVIC